MSNTPPHNRPVVWPLVVSPSAPARRRGFTLLEVLLALALTSLVLTMVGMAVNLHMRVIDVGRTDVEQAQLARALFGKIADDLRRAIPPEPVDYSAKSGRGSNSFGSSGSDDDDTDQNDSGQQGGGRDDGGRDDDLSEPPEPVAAAGLFGDRYQLQVSVSRLPRLDQYDGVVSVDASTSLVDLPSDVKTVAYYLTAGQASGGGLARRSINQAVAQWATENGNIASLDDSAQLIAPEVSSLEFRYFDGLEWLAEWDSSLDGGLPLAVEILIAIGRPGQTAGQRNFSIQAAEPASDELVYRMVVSIPAAQANSSQSSSDFTGSPGSEDTP